VLNIGGFDGRRIVFTPSPVMATIAPRRFKA
jgi:hypothetical protein